MPNSKFHTFPFHPFPKENSMGTGGMNEIFISTPPLSHGPGMHGNGWERVGTGEPKQGMFFHSIDAQGKVKHQGHLLALTAAGFGRAQLFEWFWGEPSTVIEVTPDYLSACVFYTNAAAMNAAYERWEAGND